MLREIFYSKENVSSPAPRTLEKPKNITNCLVPF